MFQAAFEGRQYQPEIEYPVSWIIGYIVGIVVFSFILQLFSFALVAHFYKMCYKMDTKSDEDIGGYFDALNGNFGKLLLLSIITFCIAILASLLCYLPIFYVMVPLQLIAPIFAFNQSLRATEITKASFKLGNKYWLIIFGIIMLSNVISQLGVLVLSLIHI